MILLDTNVVSELMRPAPDPKMRAWLGGLGAAPISTSVLTIAEVVFGLASHGCRMASAVPNSWNGSMR